jgi:hypothetical protein
MPDVSSELRHAVTGDLPLGDLPLGDLPLIEVCEVGRAALPQVRDNALSSCDDNSGG